MRRSSRDPSLSHFDKADVKEMLNKIRNNDPSTVVFKIKDHIHSDINSSVLEAIISAFHDNKVCQALYVQNISNAMGNTQLEELVNLLKKKKKIWCLNIGENYEVSNDMWDFFCKSLPDTNITHLYVSEHVISSKLKNKMRLFIRENRKKHDLHRSIKNIDVIERCTNMWWNPINGVRELKPVQPIQAPIESMAKVPKPITLTPYHTAYWQEGVGEGGNKPWKFKCVCGETCSSYENYRYHPTGKMFECSLCSAWSHVSCVLGKKISDEDLEEMEDVFCNSCFTKITRDSRRIKSEEHQVNDTKKLVKSLDRSIQIIKQKNSSKRGRKKQVKSRPIQWKFKCICGEVCSSYENPLYHPIGRLYECSDCGIWSHVLCMLGKKISDEEIDSMKALCITCKTKNRRNSKRPFMIESFPTQKISKKTNTKNQVSDKQAQKTDLPTADIQSNDTETFSFQNPTTDSEKVSNENDLSLASSSVDKSGQISQKKSSPDASLVEYLVVSDLPITNPHVDKRELDSSHPEDKKTALKHEDDNQFSSFSLFKSFFFESG